MSKYTWGHLNLNLKHWSPLTKLIKHSTVSSWLEKLLSFALWPSSESVPSPTPNRGAGLPRVMHTSVQQQQQIQTQAQTHSGPGQNELSSEHNHTLRPRTEPAELWTQSPEAVRAKQHASKHNQQIYSFFRHQIISTVAHMSWEANQVIMTS